MGERNDLLAIRKLLNIDSDINNKTDIELLHSILSMLNSSSNDEKLDLLKQSNLPDSLAFPKNIRSNHALQSKTELWNRLEKLQNMLKTDYSCRRQMLINRLDCTIESFKWKASNLAETNTSSLIHQMYDLPRARLKKDPDVTISHLLALRDTECDTLLNSVVSSTKFDCQVNYKKQQQHHQQRSIDLVNLKQIIIPSVPDRGGRTDEIRPPVKETFSQQRRARGRGNWRR